MKNNIDIQIAITNLDAELIKASGMVFDWVQYDEEWANPSWLIESCFIQLLTLTEALDLSEFRKMVFEEYTAIKNDKTAFSKTDVDPDGDPYSPVIVRIRCYLSALENMLPHVKSTTVTKDLLHIIRDINYIITDTSVFQKTPENENDVHIRIEAVLKCVYSDLKHKPVITKTIKNFEPDTGIPSLQTLIEYKYLSKKTDVKLVADQLLADTRGYISNDWTRFLYVIYETNRFCAEKDWNAFLEQSGITDNTTIIVLSGEPSVKKMIASKKGTKKKKTK